MRPGHAAVMTALGASLASAPLVGGVLAERVAGWAGEGLAQAARLFPVADGSTAGPAELALRVDTPSPPASGALPAADPVRRQGPQRVGRGVVSPAPAPRRGVFVSADTVLRLARGGTRPQGVPVPAAGARPAGLMLVGVGGLGIGLADGDVLTRAGGAPARSASDVVALVIAARGRRASAISGEVWRGNERLDLVVEQPYPTPPPAGSAAPPAAAPTRPGAGPRPAPLGAAARAPIARGNDPGDARSDRSLR